MGLARSTLPPDPPTIARILFARWYFGFPVERVDMPTVAGDAATMLATPIVYDTLTSDLGIADGDLRRWHHYSGRVRAETQLIVLAAAVITGARNRSASEPVLQEGHHNVALLRQAAEVIRDWLPLEMGSAWCIAWNRAAALVTAHRAACAVSEMAAHLASRRSLEAEEVNGVCLLHFRGLQPAGNAWSESWPPTLDHLRALQIPLHEGDAAAIGARAARSRDVAWYLATVGPRLEATAS